MQSLNVNLLRFLFLFLTAGALLWTGCEKDDDEGPDNEEELITTVRLTFTDGAGNSSVFNFSDTDGIGGNPPVAEDIILAPNTAYVLSMEFLDESNPTDVADITEEIKAEATEHLVCFDFAPPISAITRIDQDGDGKPLGLESDCTTGDAGSGALTVSLKHQPDKANANPCSTGETDVEATFEVIVQ